MAGFEVVRRKVIEGALLTVNQKTLKNKSKVYE
jgi:phosphatidylserine decarboxylase